jgi:hypothetical protein
LVNLGLAVQERLSSNIYETLKKFLQSILQPKNNDLLLDVGGVLICLTIIFPVSAKKFGF